MSVDVRVLSRDESEVLTDAAAGVFDHVVEPALAREFLEDARHHIAVALVDGVVVGFASAVHYVHPDKPPELWINEVAIAPAYQNRGLGKRVLRALLDEGRKLGCREAWVLTDRDNLPAMRLYGGLGGVEAPRDQVMFTFTLTE